MQDFLPELGSDYGFEDLYTWRVGISADGATIDGTIVHHAFFHAFRWTETDGFQDLHPYHPAQGEPIALPTASRETGRSWSVQ